MLMIPKQLRTSKVAISTLTMALIVLMIIGSIAATVIAAILFGTWFPFGQVVGSKNLVTHERSVEDFTSVEVGWGFEVEIQRTESYNVYITTDDNVYDFVEISKASNKLTIGLRWGVNYQNVTLKANITMPDLQELSFTGGTQGSIEGFSSSHEFKIELSGGCALQGDYTTTETCIFSLSGGSHMTDFDGAAKNLQISASGGSNMDLLAFSVHNATINLSGGCEAKVHLDGRLDADVTGGSQIRYTGDPVLGDINVSLDSSVEPHLP
jgi:hypothetical protein